MLPGTCLICMPRRITRHPRCHLLPFRNPLFPLSKPDQRVIQRRVHSTGFTKKYSHLSITNFDQSQITVITHSFFIWFKNLRIWNTKIALQHACIFRLIRVIDDRPNKPLGGLSHRLVESRCSSLMHRLLGKPKTLWNTIVKHCYVVRTLCEGKTVRATVAMTHDCS